MFKKDTILLDLVEKYPETEDYFRQINEEDCILCYNLFDSLEVIAEKYNLNLDKFLKEIEDQI